MERGSLAEELRRLNQYLQGLRREDLTTEEIEALRELQRVLKAIRWEAKRG